MPEDDATLVEPLENELLRASFTPSPEGDALLLATLESSDPRQRVLAVRGLTRRSLMDSTVWHHVLTDDDLEVRRDALEQFAHASIEDATLLDEVAGLLASPDPLVVDAAAFALGEHLYVGAVDALCDVAANHEDARCRESAVAALGAIGDERARSTILAALADKPPVRRRAVVALANYEGPDVEAALDGAAEDRDWQVRSAVDQLRREERD